MPLFCMNLIPTAISPKIVIESIASLWRMGTFKVALEAQVCVLGVETASPENNYQQCKMSLKSRSETYP